MPLKHATTASPPLLQLALRDRLRVSSRAVRAEDSVVARLRRRVKRRPACDAHALPISICVVDKDLRPPAAGRHPPALLGCHSARSVFHQRS